MPSTSGRQQQNQQRGHQADGHQAEQQRHGLVDLVVGAVAGRRSDESPQVARLHGVKEERPVVGHRGDVEGVVALVFRRIGAEQQVVELVVHLDARQVDGLHVGRREQGAGAVDIGGSLNGLRAISTVSSAPQPCTEPPRPTMTCRHASRLAQLAERFAWPAKPAAAIRAADRSPSG